MNCLCRYSRIADQVTRIPCCRLPNSHRASRIAYPESHCFYIVLAIMFAAGIGSGSISLAADLPDQPEEKATTTSQEQESEPLRRPLQRLEERFRGATPEERARLEEERRRLLAEAAAFGTDPTAIIGYYQLTYGHSVLTDNLRLDTATASVRVPITPNWLLLVNMPYTWADLNRSDEFPVRGAGDMTMRTGGRFYASDDVALFIGADVWFPTASETQLGTGKYMIGPGAAMAVPLARLDSLFYVIAEDFNSIGGDPSRPDLHFTQVQAAFNTIWSKQWYSLLTFSWYLDWKEGRKNTTNLISEFGYQFGEDQHWNIFAGPGVGLVGKDSPFGLDWMVQAGARWVYETPLLPETLFQPIPVK